MQEYVTTSLIRNIEDAVISGSDIAFVGRGGGKVHPTNKFTGTN